MHRILLAGCLVVAPMSALACGWGDYGCASSAFTNSVEAEADRSVRSMDRAWEHADEQYRFQQQDQRLDDVEFRLLELERYGVRGRTYPRDWRR